MTNLSARQASVISAPHKSTIKFVSGHLRLERQQVEFIQNAKGCCGFGVGRR